MSEPTHYRIDPQQEVVLISNKWHRLVDVQRALTGQGVLVPVERLVCPPCYRGAHDHHKDPFGPSDPQRCWCQCAGIGDTDAE